MILVRQYISGGFDKTNTTVNSFEEGLVLLGKTTYDITQRLEWLGFEDVFFSNTRDYIRIKK